MTTARDLIEQLDELDPNTEIRLVHQPSWPMECTLLGLVAFDESDVEAPVAWLGEGVQLGYLPGVASAQLGWVEPTLIVAVPPRTPRGQHFADVRQPGRRYR